MPEIRDKESGEPLGTVSDADLQYLIDELEETSEEDTDYYIDADTIEMLEDDGAPTTLTTLLRNGLAGRESMDIEWSRAG